MKLTLCGSARFEKLFHEWNEKLTLAGHVVYSLGIYPSSKDGNKNWYTPEQKTRLDQVHLMKILNSDGIVVVTDDTGYVGESTKNEIAWATLNDKHIFYNDDDSGLTGS